MKSGIDGILDNIQNRDNDDVLGLTKKKPKKVQAAEPVKQFDPEELEILDPEPVTEKPSLVRKKAAKGGWGSLIDDIQDRDNDDPVGRKQKKAKKSADDDGGMLETTKDLVGAGIAGVVGLGVIGGLSGMMRK
jgi:hypothetical protein